MPAHDDRQLVFPPTGGEMAALMRDKRWEETALGAVERWPGAARGGSPAADVAVRCGWLGRRSHVL
jgi:hypothetical protein